ncbi:MAG: nucleotidyltransferase family protein [Omnitrophica WOR_2 bacterium]
MVEKNEPDIPGSDIKAVRETLRELQKGLNRLYGKKRPMMLVFGSFARGHARSDSDVDVLLLYPDDIHPAEEIRRVSGILADLNLQYQVLISILPASQQKYRSSQETFWKNVRREGIPVESI